MKKVHLGIAIFFALTIGLTLSACSSIPSDLSHSETLDVSGALGGYDEAAFRAEAARPKPLLFALGGYSEYVIELPSGSEGLRADAEYLQKTLRAVVGQSDGFEICSESPSLPAIVLGMRSDHPALASVRDDGFAIAYENGDILFGGREEGGVRNAIYSFLETELGCMFVREDFDYVPTLPTIYLSGEGRVSNPDFVWRRIYQYEVSVNGWYKRLGSNGTGTDEEGSGHADGNALWGTWCHDVYDFVSPALYFETHPEYFALIRGKRRIEYKGQPAQLCLTNPEIYPIIRDSLARFIAADPDALYWDFSINDNWAPCTCSDCKKAKRKYGSDMGAMILILNRLARDFPDKYISTLAYFYNEKPPKGIELEPNVNVVIAPIASSQFYSAKYGNGNSEKAKEAVEGWSKICENLFIWDYVIDFSHLLLPYPNLEVQKENLEFYAEHNVKRVFHQGNREREGELARLRSYLLAKQLWDKDLDLNALLGKYVKVTYGAAAPYVAAYLDELHDALAQEGRDLDLYDAPSDHAEDYLSPEHLASYESQIRNALDRTLSDPRVHGYVEELQINLLYAKMQLPYASRAEKEEAASAFGELARKHGVGRVQETQDPDLETYLSTTYPALLDKAEETARLKKILTPVLAVSIAAFAILLGTLVSLFVKNRNALRERLHVRRAARLATAASAEEQGKKEGKDGKA